MEWRLSAVDCEERVPTRKRIDSRVAECVSRVQLRVWPFEEIYSWLLLQRNAGGDQVFEGHSIVVDPQFPGR